MLALTPNSFDRAAPPVAWVDGLDSVWLLERQTAGWTVVVVRQKDGQIGSGKTDDGQKWLEDGLG